MNEKNNLAAVVHYYKKKYRISYRLMAKALTENMVNASISYQSIFNWGKNNTEPNTRFLLLCLKAYMDWRRQFAIDCLEAKLPEVFEKVDNGIRLLV